MLPGPVLSAELVTTARRARYYAIRFAYGMILLFFIVLTVGQWYGQEKELWEGRELSLSRLAATGQAVFVAFAVLQGLAVLILTPALAAGAVAGEKRRRTLPYLLASRLSSAEIILGKLCSGLLHTGVFLAIGLPVLSLVSLFGGVDPIAIVLLYVGTLSTACFLAALAVLVSTLARKPGEAIAQVYVLELAWIFGPIMLAALAPQWAANWPKVGSWIKFLVTPLAWSSPLVFSGLISSGGGLVATMAKMIGLQMILAAICVLLAIALLRPTARREGEYVAERGWLGAIGRKLGARRHPEVGDDAMLWKERHVGRTSDTVRLVIRLALLVSGIWLSGATCHFAAPAFLELWHQGYSAVEVYAARETLSYYLRAVCTLVYVAWCLAAASLAAGGIVAEREADTWTSLVATPLGGEEIVRAKMIGAVWATRWLGLVLLAHWLLGLASGAVHPIGFVAVMIETAVFIWFAAALGVSMSLGATTSVRAVSATMAILLTVNGLYLFCCLPLHPDTIVVIAGITPMIEALSLLSYDQIAWLSTNPTSRHESELVLACLFGVLAYAGAALVLTTRALISFDATIDRPRRADYSTQPPAQ
jgi:ABC-type transport system involved in multi-copper enzyme maturation permease subunit